MVCDTNNNEIDKVESNYIIPGYKIQNCIKRGKYFDIYYLWSEERFCGCIGKTINPNYISDNEIKEILIKEGKLLKSLSHPNLVRIYNYYSIPIPIIIQETLTGPTLLHLIKNQQNRRLSVHECCNLGVQLCSAIQYIHNKGILHLDLTPMNVICQPPSAKLIDFSISKSPGISKKGVGTRQFMSPEQAKGGYLDNSTDIWGIGSVLYFSLSGIMPFLAHQGNRYEQLEKSIQPLKSHIKVPKDLNDIIKQCLEIKQNKRPKIPEILDVLIKYS